MLQSWLLTPVETRDVELLVDDEEELEAAAVDAEAEETGPARRPAVSLDCESGGLVIGKPSHLGLKSTRFFNA